MEDSDTSVMLCPYCNQETRYKKNARSEWGYQFMSHRMPRLRDYVARQCPMTGKWLPDYKQTKATGKG